MPGCTSGSLATELAIMDRVVFAVPVLWCSASQREAQHEPAQGGASMPGSFASVGAWRAKVTLHPERAFENPRVVVPQLPLR